MIWVSENRLPGNVQIQTVYHHWIIELIVPLKKMQCLSIFQGFSSHSQETHLETASVISLFTCRIFGAKNAQVLMFLLLVSFTNTTSCFLLWSSSLCENVLQLAMKAMAHRHRWFLYKMLLKKCDFRVCKLWNYRISRLSFKPTAFDDVSSDIKWLPKSPKNQTHESMSLMRTWGMGFPTHSGGRDVHWNWIRSSWTRLEWPRKLWFCPKGVTLLVQLILREKWWNMQLKDVKRTATLRNWWTPP